jgi:hypothetical protein
MPESFKPGIIVNETVQLKIQIANRTYPIKVREDQLIMFEKASKLIEEKLRAHEKQQGIKDLQDMMAMCLLQLAAEQISSKDQISGNEEEVKKQLQKVTELVRSFE